MTISLIDVGEVRVGRGGGNGKGKYAAYKKALVDIVPIFKAGIKEKKEVAVGLYELAKEMGPNFEKLKESSLKWGIKYALFDEGIWTRSGTDKNNSILLVLRTATEKDVLPSSLQSKADAEPDTEDEDPVAEDDEQ